MKALALVSLAALGCSVDWPLAADQVASSLLTRCQQLIPLESAPVVDGVLEPGLALLRWVDDSQPDVPPAVGADAAVAYRADGVYFFVDVEDPTRNPAPLSALAYCGDAVELFVDDDGVTQAAPDYDDPGTIQLIVAGPVDTVTPARRGQRFRFAADIGVDLGAWGSSAFVAVPTPRGYTVEAFVVADDLDLGSWALAPGGKIGWNMSLNIGGPQPAGIDACTTRSQQLHLRLATSGACTPPYCNASAFCTPTLASP
jgi:hypothetical protein